MRISALALTIGLLASAQTSSSHTTAFWRGVVQHDYDVPDGTTAAQLAPELIGSLGSTDPELRDDLAESILTRWIYTKKLLGPDDLRLLTEQLEANLRIGIGEAQGDGVLLRSFSALTLSVIAARENETPFLGRDGFQRLVEAALGYFRDEHDTRGYDPAKGWMHSVAHTSDLLKFLARNPLLPAADQPRMLAAMAAKARETSSGFSQGEDERMARIAISVIRRSDFDREAFTGWLALEQTAAAFPAHVTPDALRSHQNVRHLMMALWTELSADDRPSEGADFARLALRDTLKKLF